MLVSNKNRETFLCRIFFREFSHTTVTQPSSLLNTHLISSEAALGTLLTKTSFLCGSFTTELYNVSCIPNAWLLGILSALSSYLLISILPYLLNSSRAIPSPHSSAPLPLAKATTSSMKDRSSTQSPFSLAYPRPF